MPTQQERKHQPVGQVEAPDGGWGWVVVFALFMASALVFGLIRSLGVFFVEFVQYFGESAQAVSWITSIGVAMQQLLSPIGTAACNAYGARGVVVLGGFLSGLGLILASQATKLAHLYLTMGIISGSGWALVFTPTVASVMQYFSTRRSLAMGLGFTGVGLSSFAFSPLFQYLVQLYGWRGALLILGGLSFNIMVSGALIRPLKPTKVVEKSKSNSVSEGCMSYFELSLLLHRGFLTYSLAVTCFNAGYFIPYVHLVAHSRHVGFSEYQAAFVISSTGVTDIVGRVVAGWASDLRRIRSIHLLTIWTGLVSLFLLLLPFCSMHGNYAGLLTVSLAYGFCAGAMTPLVFSVVPEIVGMKRMVGALGLLQLIESVGGLLGAPLSGWLRDFTGSYMVSFGVASGFLCFGTILTTALPNFCSWTDPPPLSSKMIGNEFTDDDDEQIKQTLSSSEDIQNTNSTFPEALPSQNHMMETNVDIEDALLPADQTEHKPTC
ncbi:monocarboxylate transporter 13 isoform 1-T4 [Clarias gariepinus]|uniref:monocarboxylate transporter 13 n=1 Tax=Clarias gariepinus TaxID=13013 RepID=UPI00234D5035|nr:monocarboxylate transporter 13 [Clarias gariepinus]XP_053336715.1 monocarboxylate transporter 13 [Clarias gariepinus]